LARWQQPVVRERLKTSGLDEMPRLRSHPQVGPAGSGSRQRCGKATVDWVELACLDRLHARSISHDQNSTVQPQKAIAIWVVGCFREATNIITREGRTLTACLKGEFELLPVRSRHSPHTVRLAVVINAKSRRIETHPLIQELILQLLHGPSASSIRPKKPERSVGSTLCDDDGRLGLNVIFRPQILLQAFAHFKMRAS
jgi:hypothetical protein